MAENLIIPSEIIVSKIYIIRNKKVMLDKDIASLYDVKTSALNQAVKRNLDRFPGDFMFQLSKEEMRNWMSQIVISKSEKMGLRKLPLAFTEQGVAMLSSVLKSKKAVKVNIQIMRTFMQIRELLATNEALQKKIMEMESKYDSKIKNIFNILGLLLKDEGSSKNKIGFTK